MSSVTMAADSTQADFISHQRVRPSGRGGRGNHPTRNDRSRSRHRSSSRSSKRKRQSKEDRNRGRRKHSRSNDDSSDRDSDLDLSKDLLPISGYVRMKDEMVDHMFRSISSRKLRAMLPEILRPIGNEDLKRLCVEQLEVMSKKRICRILEGDDPDAISSSGTEEEDVDDAEGNSSRQSADMEGGGDIAENEAVDSTSRLANRNVRSIKDNSQNADEDGDCNPNEFTNKKNLLGNNKSRYGERSIEDDNSTDDRVDSAATEEMAGAAELEAEVGQQNFSLVGEDGCDAADDSRIISPEDNIRMTRRNAERSYRMKQLDDDDHVIESEAERRDEVEGKEANRSPGKTAAVEKSADDGTTPVDENDDVPEILSVPESLPDLESEPEETCSPFVIFGNRSDRNVQESGETKSSPTCVDVPSKTDPNASAAVIADGDGGAEQLQRSAETAATVSAKREADESLCSDVNEKSAKLSSVMEQEQVAEKKLSEVDQRASGAAKKSSSVDAANEGEEMIIVVQDHEFSDDVDEDDDDEYRFKETQIKRDEHNVAKKDLNEDTMVSRSEGAKEQRDLEGPTQTSKGRRDGGVGLSDEVSPRNEARSEIPEETRTLKKKKLEDESDCGEELPWKQMRMSPDKRKTVVASDSRKSLKAKGASPADGKSRDESVAEKRTGGVSSVSGGNVKCAERQSQLKTDPSKADSSSLDSTKKHSLVKLVTEQGSSDQTRPPKTEQTSNKKSVGTKSGSLESQTSAGSSKGERSEGLVKGDADFPTGSKTEQASPHQKSGSSSGTGKDQAPALSKTQLEILELEMRARAIKAMLKAQEELERREEMLKLEEKQDTTEPSKSSKPPESHKGVDEEKKTIRIGSSYRTGAGPGPSRSRTVSKGEQDEEKEGGRVVQRSVRRNVVVEQHRDVVRRRLQVPSGPHYSRSTALHRPAFRPHREVVSGNRFQTYRVVKRPVTVASRGRGAMGGPNAGSSSGGPQARRIIRLSGSPRTDSRTVVSGTKVNFPRTVTNVPQGNATLPERRGDVRRVIDTGRNHEMPRIASSSVRIGNRYREHGSPVREQKRSVVMWQRRAAHKR